MAPFRLPETRSMAGISAKRSFYLLVEHVALVSNQDLVDTFAGMLLHVGEPVANV